MASVRQAGERFNPISCLIGLAGSPTHKEIVWSFGRRSQLTDAADPDRSPEVGHQCLQIQSTWTKNRLSGKVIVT